MIVTLRTERTRTLELAPAFVDGNEPVDSEVVNHNAAYDLVSRTLAGFLDPPRIGPDCGTPYQRYVGTARALALPQRPLAPLSDGSYSATG